MPQPINGISYEQIVAELHARRQSHAKAIAQIDAILSRTQTNSGGPASSSILRKRGRPAARATVADSAPAKLRGRRRGRHGQTASALIQSLLERGPLSTQELNAKWKQTRGGTSDNTLTELTKSGAIIRTKIEGGRGSRYSLPK